MMWLSWLSHWREKGQTSESSPWFWLGKGQSPFSFLDLLFEKEITWNGNSCQHRFWSRDNGMKEVLLQDMKHPFTQRSKSGPGGEEEQRSGWESDINCSTTIIKKNKTLYHVHPPRKTATQ